jgi:hypothetical protein
MCQLKYVHELVHESSWLDDSYASLRRKLAQIYIKATFLKKKVLLTLSPTKERPFLQNFEQSQIYPGDTVRVLSKEKIKNLLDHRGAYKGCDFMEEMYNCCGKEYKVLTKVAYFYDESKQKLCKCKDIFFLEGASCSGRMRLYLEPCDLKCFFFWHKDLLEKT